MWQEIIFSVGGVFFIITLIPSIMTENKPDIRTSIPTALILYVFAATWLTLKFYLTAAVIFLTAIAWTILGLQKYRSNHKK